MSGFTDAFVDELLDNAAGRITAIGLHSADPGAAGTLNELNGGTPPYARKTPTYAAAATKAADLSAPLDFDVPAGAEVAFVSYWEGATFAGSEPVTTPETFGAQGVYELTSAKITGSSS